MRSNGYNYSYKNSRSLEDAKCPTPEDVSTIRYNLLTKQNKYPSKKAFLNEIAPMIARGQVTSMPVCHPKLYEQVAEITSEWTFNELHACATYSIRQCPIRLRDLQPMVNDADFLPLRYVLLRLAAERPNDSAARIIMQDIDGFKEITMLLEGIEDVDSGEVFDVSTYAPFWFLPSELSDLFNISVSSTVSEASRTFSSVHGHYLIRRKITPEEREHVKGSRTYVYRPASLVEKVRDLISNHDYDVEQVAFDSGLPESEIQSYYDLDASEVVPLNPFDMTASPGEVNFDKLLTYVQEESFALKPSTGREDFYSSLRAHHVTPGSTATNTQEDFPMTVNNTIMPYYYPYGPTYSEPAPSAFPPTYTYGQRVTTTRDPDTDLALKLNGILSFAKEVGAVVTLPVLAASTGSSLTEITAALSTLPPALLEDTF